MRLWPEEYEELRAEAREMIAAGLGAFQEQVQGDADADRLVAARTALSFMEVEVDSGEDREIAGVPCRVFVPDGPATAVYLHFHGGGMVMGSPLMNDAGNEQICRDYGMAVVSVDYRLAPEHPFPAGPDDGLAVARWVVEEGEAEFGSPRIVLGGESAGGYMAGITALRIRDELDAVDRVLGANLVFGVFDWGRSPSQRGVRPDPSLPDVLDPEGIEWFTGCFVPDRTDDERRDPAISPAFADLRGLPPALFSVGSADHLLDDTLMTAGRWAACGNDVELWVGPDLPHAYPWFPCELTKRWLATQDDWFRRILGS